MSFFSCFSLVQRVGVVFIALVLAGCAVPTKRVDQARTLLQQVQSEETTCSLPNHCAAPSPLRKQARQAMHQTAPGHPVHYVTLLDKPEQALAARLSLIRSARHRIDVQTYIWENDDLGKLMIDALVKAARRGVEVRILADQLFSFSSVAQLAQLARSTPHLSVRLYNPTFDKSQTSAFGFVVGGLCCFKRFNQRMHNKLLVVDRVSGITGGRNYQNRYFGWDARFNYRDRDVLVSGPAAVEMANTFNAFWYHRRSKPLIALRDVNHRLLADGRQGKKWHSPAYTHPQRVARAEKHAASEHWLQTHILSHSFKVGRVAYFSDYPRKTAQPQQERLKQLTHHIMAMVAGAKNQIVIQTPYLVLSRRARHIFKKLYKKNHPPRIIISTNSLASTDAFVSYAMSYKHQRTYLKAYGFEIYELRPHPADTALSVSPPGVMKTGKPSSREAQGNEHGRGVRHQPPPLLDKSMRIGLHAKSIVVDDRFAMVGSHNFDPRSDHYNTEAGIIVYDKAFATALKVQILRDTVNKNAWTVAPRENKIPILSDISRVLGVVSSHLPWFDLWPFRYTTCYTLKEGYRPLSPVDPRFFKHYKPVGDFPGVDLPLKTIYTRLATGFGYGISGVL